MSSKRNCWVCLKLHFRAERLFAPVLSGKLSVTSFSGDENERCGRQEILTLHICSLMILIIGANCKEIPNLCYAGKTVGDASLYS